MREKHFHNRVFDSLEVLADHLVQGLRDLETSPAQVKGITARDGVINAVSNANQNDLSGACCLAVRMDCNCPSSHCLLSVGGAEPHLTL